MATLFNFDFLTNYVSHVIVFGQDWLLMLFMTILISLVITRNPRNIGITFLPVLVGLQIIGFTMNYIIYRGFVVVAVIVFLVNTLSYELISSTIRTSVSSISSNIEKIKKYGKIKRSISDVVMDKYGYEVTDKDMKEIQYSKSVGKMAGKVAYLEKLKKFKEDKLKEPKVSFGYENEFIEKPKQEKIIIEEMLDKKNKEEQLKILA